MLHLELCQLQTDDWKQMLRHRGMQPTPTKSRETANSHVPVQTDEWRKGNTTDTRKRRQRACKVCSVLKSASESRGGESTFFCGGCKLKSSSKHQQAARVFLCNKVKHTSNGQALSCFEIWHRHWKNGTRIPQARAKRHIRARKPAQSNTGDGSDCSDEGDVSDNGNEAPSSLRQRKRARASDHGS